MPNFTESKLQIPIIYRSSFFHTALWVHVNACRRMGMNAHEAIQDFVDAFGFEDLSIPALYSTYNRKQQEWISAKRDDVNMERILLREMFPEHLIKQLADEIAKHIKCDQL